MATLLVTGSNRGIGLEVCRQLAARGDRVIGVCRQSSDALDALDVHVIDGVDVATAEGVAKLSDALGDQAIDVLINNAGILRRDTFDNVDLEDVAEQFRVNSIAPLRVTTGLSGNLREGAKVVIVTSRMGSVADNTSGGYYGYRASKAAVNAIGMSLARDLASRGVAVALLHPGMVATDMTGGQGVEVEASAAGLLQRIDALSMDNTGSFWHAEGYELPW